MLEAFFEASIRVKAAALCFLMAKFLSIVTLVSMMLSDIVFYINFGFYTLFIVTSITLCIVELVKAGHDRIFPTYQKVKQ